MDRRYRLYSKNSNISNILFFGNILKMDTNSYLNSFTYNSINPFNCRELINLA